MSQIDQITERLVPTPDTAWLDGDPLADAWFAKRSRAWKVTEATLRLRNQHSGVRLVRVVKKECGLGPMFWVQVAWWVYKILKWADILESGA